MTSGTTVSNSGNLSSHLDLQEETLKPIFVLHLTEVITDWIGKITSFLIFAIIGYMIGCVILRYFFNSAINYMAIIPNIFYVYVSFGAAHAYNRKAFINVDIIYRKFSLRKRAVIDLITSSLFFLFVLALVWVSGKYALAALPKTRFDWGMIVDPVRWPPIILFPIGLILMLSSGIVRFARNFITLITGQEAT